MSTQVSKQYKIGGPTSGLDESVCVSDILYETNSVLFNLFDESAVFDENSISTDNMASNDLTKESSSSSVVIAYLKKIDARLEKVENKIEKLDKLQEKVSSFE